MRYLTQTADVHAAKQQVDRRQDVVSFGACGVSPVAARSTMSRGAMSLSAKSLSAIPRPVAGSLLSAFSALTAVMLFAALVLGAGPAFGQSELVDVKPVPVKDSAPIAVPPTGSAADSAANPDGSADPAALILEASSYRELDLFLAQSLARPLTGDLGATEVSDIDQSLRDSDGEDTTQFFVLDDNRPEVITHTSPALGGSSLLGASGLLRSRGDQALYGTSGRVGFTIGTALNADGSIDRGFEVALMSAYQEVGLDQDSGSIDALLLTGADVADREYNVGLQLGYSGFNIDASLVRRDSAFADATEGLEAGLSYQGDVFAARLSAAEYRRGKDLLGIENAARRLISFELEASYKLTRRLGLTAGARYSTFGEQFLLTKLGANESQMIFVGGRFSF